MICTALLLYHSTVHSLTPRAVSNWWRPRNEVNSTAPIKHTLCNQQKFPFVDKLEHYVNIAHTIYPATTITMFVQSLEIAAAGSSPNSSQRMLPQSVMDNITCAPEFSLINGSCVARCDSWKQSSPSVTFAVMVVEIVAAALGLLAGITLLVLSCIRWRNMYVRCRLVILYLHRM